MTPAAPKPIISSLDPASVRTGWTGVLRINGSGFTDGDLVSFEGPTAGGYPAVKYKSPQQLEVVIKKILSMTPETMKVTVETKNGDKSNQVMFDVR
jgi:hypothetical protein